MHFSTVLLHLKRRLSSSTIFPQVFRESLFSSNSWFSTQRSTSSFSSSFDHVSYDFSFAVFPCELTSSSSVPFWLACVAGRSGYPRIGPKRECKNCSGREKNEESSPRGGSLRGNFAAKSFTRAPTPASYAGYILTGNHLIIARWRILLYSTGNRHGHGGIGTPVRI